jgi:arylsulfatase A-like enzyme
MSCPARKNASRFTLLFIAALFAAGVHKTAAAETAKPNVVFILADDLGWGELGCYGQQKIPTPNIDRLAAEGMRFTQHYSGAPVCAPSRCVLLTGKHTGHAEVRGNLPAGNVFPQFTEGQYPISADAVTLAEVFQAAGYATGAFGKWGLGPVGSTGDPNKQGFDTFFGYNCQSVAHSYYPPYLWRNSERVVINSRPVSGHADPVRGSVRMDDWVGENYAPSLMVDEAVKFIDANKSRPFFLYLPFIEPHLAMHPPRQSVERFPESWDVEPYRGEQGYLPHPRPRAAYAAMISDLDSYVGRVIAALESAGVADQTLVVFSSDNGTTHARSERAPVHVGGVDAAFFNSTAGLRGCKGSLYEGGIRVPMIVRLPGRVQAGEVNGTPSYFADWFPTLCAAAGLETPPGLDGENLWPLVIGQSGFERKTPMVWVFTEYGGQVAVRIGNFKVIRQGLKTKNPGSWEVYDLTEDRAEEHDLSAERPNVIQQAKDVLRREVSDNAIFPLTIPDVLRAAGAGKHADDSSSVASEPVPVVGVRKTLVFKSGEDGYHTYRIPTIVKVMNGDLLAFAEGRKNGPADHGDIDIVLKRSSDDGRSWSDMQLVQDEWDAPNANVTIGNPSPVVDRLAANHAGRVWLAFTRNNARVFVTHSDDQGATWSTRRDITSTAMDPAWDWYATGPVHGIQLERGANAGRLVIPSDHRSSARDTWGAHILYSSDHGATWQIGAVDTRSAPSGLHPNECVAVELVDGRVYVNARDQHGADAATRAVAHSRDGGLNFDAPFVAEAGITTPVVQNSLARFRATDEGAPRNVLIYSAPGHASKRRDLTILASVDEGKTWNSKTVLHKGPTAYSDLVKLDDERMGVLFEAGTKLYDEILFASFGFDDLTCEPQ